jgi:anti-sigma factor RsiW
MTMHEQWTDTLSDYLDGELAPAERAAVDAHLKECASCAAVLNDLKHVVVRAQTLEPRNPNADLWPGVRTRIAAIAQPRRFSFTLGQLAAAAVLLIAVSAAVVWQLAARTANRVIPPAASEQASTPAAGAAAPTSEWNDRAVADGAAAPVSYADAQYDAAVADLEKALQAGRARLDRTTIEIVEQNLQIIDHAIRQAREALSADPANSYLSQHLVEARRRKLDLLRRAAALAESD